MVHDAASEAKPTPVTTIFRLADPTGGVKLMDGRTRNGAVPLSEPPGMGHVTVIVYTPPPGAPGPFPTLNDPYAVPLNTLAVASVTILAVVVVIVQLVQSAAEVPVALTSVMFPYLPDVMRFVP